jgi:SpoVK/Ycf46/Vps4 family AAA+-type ATPase
MRLDEKKMTTTRMLTDLFRAIGAEDFNAASSIAESLCKAEEKKGHRTAARLLRGALKGTGVSSRASHDRFKEISSATNFLPAALLRLKGQTDLESVVLSSAVRLDLKSVITEWQHIEQLRKLDIAPRSKLLFHGPPGCGKSLTALALGNALKLPVYIVRFDAVIGAYLGQTAMHLRQLFHFAETTSCVLLLDELDALGKQRGNQLDVGELDRVVISLLQELEHSQPKGIVIGTTNLPAQLDDALWRRFDLDVQFKAPTQSTLRSYIKRIAAEKKTRLSPEVLAKAVQAPSFSAAEKLILAVVRQQVIASLR